jgi:hypothetical protein
MFKQYKAEFESVVPQQRRYFGAESQGGNLLGALFVLCSQFFLKSIKNFVIIVFKKEKIFFLLVSS